MPKSTKVPFEVTLDATVVTSVPLKIMLAVFWALILSLAIFVLSLFDETEAKGVLVCSVGFGTVLFFLGKYAAWNLWGREWIKITTKSILYSRSYGFYTIPAKSIVFDYLATHIEQTREYDGITYGIINLYDRNANTMQLVPRFSSGVNLPVPQLSDFIQKVHQLFNHDEESSLRWLPFSHN